MRGWVKVLLFMIFLSLVVGGVVAYVLGRPVAFEVFQRRTAARFPEVRWITTDQLGRWQDDTGQPQPVLLDARTPAEFGISHLKGAIPIDPYRPDLKSLEGSSKTSAVVVYSSAGYRGARVASWLMNQGYSSVTNLAGGIFKWVNEGRPIFRAENRPAALVHPYDQRWGLLVEGRYRASTPNLEKKSAAP